MPKRVDPAERRAHIVEALLTIAGQRGIDAVSLREVAQEAGVSMGAVQHYFASKDEMLSYALEHWLALSVHQRFTQRIRDRAGSASPVPEPVKVLYAMAAEYLPHDEESRADVRVALAFIERAAAQPDLARAMRGAFTGFTNAPGAAGGQRPGPGRERRGAAAGGAAGGAALRGAAGRTAAPRGDGRGHPPPGGYRHPGRLAASPANGWQLAARRRCARRR